MKILELHLYPYIEYAQLRGIGEIHSKWRDTRPDPSQNKMVDVEDLYAVVELLRNSLKEDQLGIRLGNFMNLKALGLIYQISLQTTTIQEALFYLRDYLNATLPIVEIDTKVSENVAYIELKINNYNASNVVILENVLTVISRELKIMSRQDLKVTIRSPFVNENYPQGWEKGKDFSLAFENTVLKASLQDRSKWQLDVLVPEYLKMIEGFKKEESFRTRVKIAMLSMAKPELPTLEMVADAFNLSPRTFQRRLNNEDASFRDIYIELKKQLSFLLINHNRFSVSEISDILGFSEPASFIHSFKKWYGNTPDKYRTAGICLQN